MRGRCFAKEHVQPSQAVPHRGSLDFHFPPLHHVLYISSDTGRTCELLHKDQITSCLPIRVCGWIQSGLNASESSLVNAPAFLMLPEIGWNDCLNLDTTSPTDHTIRVGRFEYGASIVESGKRPSAPLTQEVEARVSNVPQETYPM